MITSAHNTYKITKHMSKALLDEADERSANYIQEITDEMIDRMENDPDFLLNPIPEKYTNKELPPNVVLNYYLVQMQPPSDKEDQFIN